MFDSVKNKSPADAGLESVTTSNGRGTYPSCLASYQLFVVMGRSGGVMDSAVAADLNLSVLLPGKPSSGHHCKSIVGVGEEDCNTQNIGIDTYGIDFVLAYSGERKLLVIKSAD